MAKPSKLAKDIKFAQNMNSTFVDPMLEKIFQEECKSFFVKYPINKFKASLLVTILMAKLLYWSEF